MPSEARQNDSQKSDNTGSSVKIKSNKPTSHDGKRYDTARDRSVSFGSDSSGTPKQRGGKTIKGKDYLMQVIAVISFKVLNTQTPLKPRIKHVISYQIFLILKLI